MKNLKIPSPRPGYERQWLRCRTCGCVQYYDYVPFSLSNPIRWTRCGHGVTERDFAAVAFEDFLIALLGCDDIDEQTALDTLVVDK